MRKDLYKDLYSLEGQHWWHISKRRVVTSCIQYYLKKRDAKILDVGCGTGKNLEQLKKFGKVYGLDGSSEAIKFCKKRGLENLELGKAEDMPFQQNSFDLITLLDVLEHTDDNKTLQEVYRILKKDGLLILTVPALSWLWSEWDKILNHRRRYNKYGIISLLNKNKFNVIKATYLYSFLVFPALIIRKMKQSLFRKKEYSSDFQLSNPLLNRIMGYVSNIEFKLAKKITIPIGTTILVIAKK